MTNKRLDEALTNIEIALDELTKALAHHQQAQQETAQNAAQTAQQTAHSSSDGISAEEMASMRGELADAMDIVRQLQSLDSVSDASADSTQEPS